jgi:hypothetical protein
LAALERTAVVVNGDERAESVRRPPSNPRTIAAFLREVRALVDRLQGPQRVWIRDLGLLLRDARAGSETIGDVPVRAGELGRAHAERLRPLREQAATIQLPDVCASCHAFLLVWLDKHIAACEALVEVETTQDTGHLRTVHGLFGDARAEMRRFTAEFADLASAVKRETGRREQSRKDQQRRQGLGRILTP